MTKKRIVVGNEYARAFESVCAVVESGYLGDAGITVTGKGYRREIDDGTYLYSLGDAAENDEADEIFLGTEGASWFSSFRGVQQDNQNAVWIAFVESVASKYHKRYSLVEYREQERDEKELAQQERILTEYMNNLRTAFFPEMGQFELRRLPAEESVDDIYGVSMRLELSGGTGAAVPVLGKVYFRKRGNSMIPLHRDEGARVDGYLNEIVPEASRKQAAEKTDEDIVGISLVALENLIKGNIAGADFTSSMCPSGDSDRDTLESLRRQTARDEVVTLECSQLRVLGVSHIRWNNYGMDVFVNRQPRFRLFLTFGTNLSMSCLNCGEGNGIIENSIVRYRDGEGEEHAFPLDPTREDLGLSKEELEAVRESRVFSSHFVTLACKENVRNPSCSRTLCACQTETFEWKGKKIVKCRDCPYPEIVYTGAEGKALYTPALVFAKDRGDLVPEEETLVCACCGRTYTKQGVRGRLCALCSEAESEDPEAQKTYRRYRGALSLALRLKYLSRKKFCYEDDEVLLFSLGDDKYLFDKIDAGESGYLSKPRKL